MSVRIMAEVFDRYPGGGTELLLALAIADHAHDDGTNVYPSVKRLAEKTRQSERSVQYHLRKMEETGWLLLVREAVGGRGGAGMPREYRINPSWIKGADFAPIEKGADFSGAEKGAADDGKGCKPAQERVQTSAEKGATAIAPEPSYNHKATVSEPERDAPKRARSSDATAALLDELLPDWVPRDLWDSWWFDTRRKIRAPNTPDALRLNINSLTRLRAQGHDPRAVIESSIEFGYRGLFEPKNRNAKNHAGGRRESDSERAERLANAAAGRG